MSGTPRVNVPKLGRRRCVTAQLYRRRWQVRVRKEEPAVHTYIGQLRTGSGQSVKGPAHDLKRVSKEESAVYTFWTDC